MRIAWALVAAAGFCGSGARGDDAGPLLGHWEGRLDLGGPSLRMVVDVARGEGAALKATFASPDQGGAAVAVDSASIEGGEFRFAIRAIAGAYRGKVGPKGDEAVGTWTQGGRDFPLTLTKGAAAKPPEAPAALIGIWEGTIELPGLGLRLGMLVKADAGGTRVATLSSPDQGAEAIVVSAIGLVGDEVKVESNAIGGAFAGKLDAGRGEIVGKWSQGGRSFPLTMRKVEKPTERKRPQTPKAPFPYRTEGVSYPNPASGFKLAGTLTIPSGPGPFPAAILITGSGPQDRDETILGHKPFLVIADALTRRGVAVLRVDDRGVGGSTGSTAAATSLDFAGDVRAGLAYLKSRPEVDHRATGLIGHSEGGLIAPLVAARSAEVGFVVLLAGPGTNGLQVLKAQSRLILKAGGATEQVVVAQETLLDGMAAIVRSETDEKAAAAKLEALTRAALALIPAGEKKALGELGKTTAEAEVKRVNSPWFRFFLEHEPGPDLAATRCPVLALNGAKDLQVSAGENLAAIAAALKSGGNTRATVKELPGLNHLFQRCETGAPSEYAAIEETIDPAVLTLLGDWILSTTDRP